MTEHVANLTCGSGHEVEVHWAEGQQAEHWQCPTCLEAFHAWQSAEAVADNAQSGPEALRNGLRQAGIWAHEKSLVRFESVAN